MGAKLLSATLGALLMVAFIDVFVLWYARFLQKMMPDQKTRKMLQQLVWALLALIFWATLKKVGLPEVFGLTYFLFVLFIYSVRGLILAFFRTEKGGGGYQTRN